MRRQTQLAMIGAVMAMQADPIMGHTQDARDLWSKPRGETCTPSSNKRSKIKAARKQRRKSRSK